MLDLVLEDELAVERLAFALLGDAYRDLAAVLRNLNPTGCRIVFDTIEHSLTDALNKLQAGEGPASVEIKMRVATKLSRAMDEARGPFFDQVKAG